MKSTWWDSQETQLLVSKADDIKIRSTLLQELDKYASLLFEDLGDQIVGQEKMAVNKSTIKAYRLTNLKYPIKCVEKRTATMIECHCASFHYNKNRLAPTKYCQS